MDDHERIRHHDQAAILLAAQCSNDRLELGRVTHSGYEGASGRFERVQI
jgi:hypothetical protein